DDQNAAVKVAREGTYDVEHRVERARRPADDDDVPPRVSVRVSRMSGSPGRVLLVVHSAEPWSVWARLCRSAKRSAGNASLLARCYRCQRLRAEHVPISAPK